MPETPKRSLGETIGQLLVIVILIGILIGAIILLVEFIHSHANSQSISASTLNITCCTGLDTTSASHPGEVVRLAASRGGDTAIWSLTYSSTEYAAANWSLST